MRQGAASARRGGHMSQAHAPTAERLRLQAGARGATLYSPGTISFYMSGAPSWILGAPSLSAFFADRVDFGSPSSWAPHPYRRFLAIGWDSTNFRGHTT